MTDTKMLRRVESSKPWADDVNRLIDTFLGNTGGRLKLWGDSGDELDLLSGDVASTGNYTHDVMNAGGNHLRVRKSDDTADVLAVDDDALTVGGAVAANGGLTLPNNLALASSYSGSPVNLVRMDSGGIFRLGTPAVARTFLYGTTIELLNSTGTVFMVDGNKAGFWGKSTVQGNVGAAATDAASTQTLANNIRTLLRNLGLSA